VIMNEYFQLLLKQSTEQVLVLQPLNTLTHPRVHGSQYWYPTLKGQKISECPSRFACEDGTTRCRLPLTAGTPTGLIIKCLSVLVLGVLHFFLSPPGFQSGNYRPGSIILISHLVLYYNTCTITLLSSLHIGEAKLHSSY